MVVDLRGKHMTEAAERNKEKIRKYFLSHPGSGIMKAADELGMSPMTVRKHVNSLESD